MLAHQGGWDELLLTSVLVLGMLGWQSLRRRRREARPATGSSLRCAYCDASLEPGAERCAACGFRTPRSTGEPTVRSEPR